MSIKIRLLIFLNLIFFSFTVQSAPPEKSPKKWPCDQVYNPKLNLSSIWQGPSIDSALKDWWKEILPILEHNQKHFLNLMNIKTNKVKLLEKIND